jgi:hypothetical protein
MPSGRPDHPVSELWALRRRLSRLPVFALGSCDQSFRRTVTTLP